MVSTRRNVCLLYTDLLETEQKGEFLKKIKIKKEKFFYRLMYRINKYGSQCIQYFDIAAYKVAKQAAMNLDNDARFSNISLEVVPASTDERYYRRNNG